MLLEQLGIDQIREPRLDIRVWVSKEGLDELTESVRTRGVLQPIRVIKDGDGYEIQDGHRRFMAAKAAGLTHIPALIIDDTEAENEVDKIHANLCREDLSPLEISRHLSVLRNRYNYTVEYLAQLMGVTTGRIRQLIHLQNLPEDLVKAIEDKRIGERVAVALAQVEDPARRTYLLQYALDQGASVRTIENWVRFEKSRTVEPPRYEGTETTLSPPEEVGPLKLQCRCCHDKINANSILAMQLCPECYAIAERLFREIRKGAEEEKSVDGVEAL